MQPEHIERNPARALALLAFLGWFLFLFSVIAGCGTGDSIKRVDPVAYVQGIPVCSGAGPDEIDALTALSGAVTELGYPLPDECVFFVFSPEDRIPEVCRDGDCTTNWLELPGLTGTACKNPKEGWRGWQTDGYIFVRRFGEAAPYLESLLAHEFSHAVCDCGHEARQKAVEMEIRNLM
jgi:hypothetical protein